MLGSGPAIGGNGISLLLSAALVLPGCAVHTPERATIRFVHELNGGAARLEGSAAFESARSALNLKENRRTEASKFVFGRSANWNHKNNRIGLISSNVLRDPPERFDLRLSWSPPRRLRLGLLEGLLGRAYGISATWNNGWVIDGGILEYRITGTETPYLLFSSPAYVRDPLDFLEDRNLPHLPTLQEVSEYVERNASVHMSIHVEEYGAESKRSCMPTGVCITVYAASGPQHVDYLEGLAISVPGKNGLSASAADFLPVLIGLGIENSRQIVAAIFGSNVSAAPGLDGTGFNAFAVYGNFALALSHASGSDPMESSLWIWRRIEAPQSWCKHLRPDLERCSESGLE